VPAKAENPLVRIERQELARIRQEMRDFKPRLDAAKDYWSSLKGEKSAQEQKLAKAKKEDRKRTKLYHSQMRYYDLGHHPKFDLTQRHVGAGIVRYGVSGS
jgi:predicted  nucleic acid-binding Zn-ribbon protein